jgi:hypothetical protein
MISASREAMVIENNVVGKTGVAEPKAAHIL